MLVPVYHLNNNFQYFCDYFYKSSSYTTYPLRGGYSNSNFQDGILLINFVQGSGAAHVWHGASLSFKPIA